jgi:hypothetical protein
MVDRPTPVEEFHARVEAYLEATGMSAARLGLVVCKDASFVFDLRAGREPRFSTIEKVDAFMREHPNGEGKDGAPETGSAACASGS